MSRRGFDRNEAATGILAPFRRRRAETLAGGAESVVVAKIIPFPTPRREVSAVDLWLETARLFDEEARRRDAGSPCERPRPPRARR